MRIFVLATVLVAAGCGGSIGAAGGAPDGAVAPDPIVGLWEAQQSCAMSFDFHADGTFGEATACAVGYGIGIQVEQGTFTDAGALLVLTTTEATCPGWSKVSSATYSVESGRLELSDQSAIVVLTPATAGGGSAVGTFGCFFDANGVSQPFQASPLAPL